MSDDELVAYLVGDADRLPADPDAARVERTRALLDDPDLWAEPTPELEQRVIDAALAAGISTPGARAARTPYVAAAGSRNSVIAAAAAVAAGRRSGRGRQQPAQPPDRVRRDASGHRTRPNRNRISHDDPDQQRLEDPPPGHRPAAAGQRPLLPGLAQGRRGHLVPDRHVQPGHRRHALVRCAAQRLPRHHHHPADRQRRPGVVRSEGPRRHDHRVH